MRHLCCALIAVAAFAVSAAPASASASPYVRECGSRSVDAGGSTSYDMPMMVTYGVGCRQAFRIALAWLRAADSSRPNARPQGFRCAWLHDGSGAKCRKARRWLSWGTH